MRTAILGIGSLGTIIGALITKGGVAIDMIDVNQATVDALNTMGATITGSLELNVPVRALTPDQMTGVYDLVILTTKQTYSDAALKQLLPHLSEDGAICTLQNGIPEETIVAYVGQSRVVGGSVGFGATWIKPGVSMLTSTYESMRQYSFEIGQIDGAISPKLSQVKDILSLVGGTTMSTNLMNVRWTKLLMNAAFSGMSAALGCTFGDVLNHPQAMVCLAHIVDETIKACHASGCRILNLHGADFESLELKSDEDIPGKMKFYQIVWGPHVKLRASMLQDIEKGIKCEIDYINGVVCRQGRKFGLPTPYNDKVVELVKKSEAAGRINSMRDLAEFDVLIHRSGSVRP